MLEDVFKESVQELGVVMSTGENGGSGKGSVSGPGIVPVVSGNMANSVTIKIGQMPTTVDGETKFTTPDLSSASLLKVGDTAYLGYQAAYARRVNYGFTGEDSLGRSYNQAGRGFLEAAAARWPRIVEGAVVAVRARSGA